MTKMGQKLKKCTKKSRCLSAFSVFVLLKFLRVIPKITSWKSRGGARAPVPHSWRRQWPTVSHVRPADACLWRAPDCIAHRVAVDGRYLVTWTLDSFAAASPASESQNMTWKVPTDFCSRIKPYTKFDTIKYWDNEKIKPLASPRLIYRAYAALAIFRQNRTHVECNFLVFTHVSFSLHDVVLRLLMYKSSAFMRINCNFVRRLD